MDSSILSYGLPSLFALANAAALIWIKSYVERRDKQAEKAISDADARAARSEELRLQREVSLRAEDQTMWERMREEVTDLRQRLSREEQAHDLCKAKILELDRRILELERVR